MTKNKIILSVIFLVCGQLAGFSQEEVENKLFFDGLFRPETESKYIRYYGVPKKVSKGQYEVTFYTLHGQKIATGEYQSPNFKYRHGSFVGYNQQERIIVTTSYRNNLVHGNYQTYHDNGMLADSGSVRFGFAIGHWRSWFDNGVVREQKYFHIARGARGSQTSVLEDEFISRFPDGSTRDSGYYKNNQRVGVWVEWLQPGQLRSMGEYKKGYKRGLWKYYDQRGRLLYMRRFNSFRYDTVGELVEIKK